MNQCMLQIYCFSQLLLPVKTAWYRLLAKKYHGYIFNIIKLLDRRYNIRGKPGHELATNYSIHTYIHTCAPTGYCIYIHIEGFHEYTILVNCCSYCHFGVQPYGTFLLYVAHRLPCGQAGRRKSSCFKKILKSCTTCLLICFSNVWIDFWHC